MIDYTDPMPYLRGIIAAAGQRWPIKTGAGSPDFPTPIGLLMASADEIARLRDESKRLREQIASLREGARIRKEGQHDQAEASVPDSATGPGDPERRSDG